MNSTMQEIELQDQSQDQSTGNKRTDLKSDIANLEQDIVDAEANVKRLKDEDPYTPISPELANEHKRGIVFLRKDLEKKKAEFSDLDK
ncbi:MAG: hypothetical protein KW788_05160 [Candidatus Doudnabacteria bacterium]|nr:hypothetical protein [Candidatus Doudnabacteria bacterium]